jgi:CheY-like chemotaxis protein
MSYILVVEDNQQTADMISHILKTAGYMVKQTAHGLEGAKLAQAERPSLILMDFDLPDIDGRTLTLTLKKRLGGNSAPPIVACTARSGHNEASLAAKFGCSAFISKPFAPELLLKVVDQMLKQSQPAQI